MKENESTHDNDEQDASYQLDTFENIMNDIAGVSVQEDETHDGQ